MSTPPNPLFEPHRPFVRELNRLIQTDYGLGGLIALGAAAVPPLLAWLLGAVSSAVPWALALLNFLVGMFFVRSWLRRRAQQRLAQLDGYCGVNELSRAGLQRYFAPDGVYAFFATLPQDSTT